MSGVLHTSGCEKPIRSDRLLPQWFHFSWRHRDPEGSIGYLFICCSEFSYGTSRGFILSLFLCDTYLIHCEDCDGLCMTVLPVHWWHFDLCDFFCWAGGKRIIFVLFFMNKKIDKGEYNLLNFITAKMCLQMLIYNTVFWSLWIIYLWIIFFIWLVSDWFT